MKVYNSLGYASQDPTFKAINQDYHRISRDEIIFLIEQCKICQKKS